MPLADLARKTQAEKKSKSHVSARRVLTEENLARPGWGKWTETFGATYPPASLSIAAPKEWNFLTYQNLQAVIEKTGVYIQFGGTDWSGGGMEDMRSNLQLIFQRSIYYGAAVKVRQVEDTSIDGQQALLVHFDFLFKNIQHSGVALFVRAPEQVMSAGCMYRDADREKASLICEQVMSSAEIKLPTDYRLIKGPRQ